MEEPALKVRSIVEGPARSVEVCSGRTVLEGSVPGRGVEFHTGGTVLEGGVPGRVLRSAVINFCKPILITPKK